MERPMHVHEHADRRSHALWAAAEIFARRGYADTGIPDITAASGMTMKELSTHFESREALAREIIDAGNARAMFACWQLLAGDQSPFEALIDTSLMIARLANEDPLVRAMGVLATEIHDGRGLTTDPFVEQIEFVREMLTRAAAGGELLPDADPDIIASAFTHSFQGARRESARHSNYADFPHRVVRLWQLLLPVITTPPRVEYLNAYLRRQQAATG